MRSPYLCLKTKSHEPTRSHIVCYDILNAYISEGLKILHSNQNQSQALFNTKLLKLQRTPQILFKIFPVFNMQFIKFPSSIHHTHANDLCFPTEKLVFDHNDNLLLLLHIKHIMEFQTSEQRLNHIEETYWDEYPFLQSLCLMNSARFTSQQGLQDQEPCFWEMSC